MTISGLKDNPQFLYKSQLLLFELEQTLSKVSGLVLKISEALT